MENVLLLVFSPVDYKLHLFHNVLIIYFFYSFQVVTSGNPVLDYETMPKRFDLQIFVEDTTGRTDLSTLTVQVVDKNEPPVFRGNMAIQSKMAEALEKNNTEKADITYKTELHTVTVVKVV